ncbi:chemotaxis protein CheW, partial [Vibrio genomosp. F10]
MEQAEPKMDKNSNKGQLFVDIGEEVFSIPIYFVKEVIELGKITMVPMCSNIIVGVTNIRGSVV